MTLAQHSATIVIVVTVAEAVCSVSDHHAIPLCKYALGAVGTCHPHHRPPVQFQAAQVGVFQQYRRVAQHPAGKRQDAEVEIFGDFVVALPVHCGFGAGLCFPVPS